MQSLSFLFTLRKHQIRVETRRYAGSLKRPPPQQAPCSACEVSASLLTEAFCPPNTRRDEETERERG